MLFNLVTNTQKKECLLVSNGNFKLNPPLASFVSPSKRSNQITRWFELIVISGNVLLGTCGSAEQTPWQTQLVCIAIGLSVQSILTTTLYNFTDFVGYNCKNIASSKYGRVKQAILVLFLIKKRLDSILSLLRGSEVNIFLKVVNYKIQQQTCCQFEVINIIVSFFLLCANRKVILGNCVN